MGKKKASSDGGPTKQSIATLLRELSNRWNGPAWQRYQDLDAECDEERERILLASPTLCELEKKKELARKEAEKWSERVRAVHQLFLAEGITPRVLFRVQKLVEAEPE